MPILAGVEDMASFDVAGLLGFGIIERDARIVLHESPGLTHGGRLGAKSSEQNK
jgi:hypothetical protein